MQGTGVIDRFMEVFTSYIDSGFGLLGGEVAFLSSTLVAIDIVLAGLFWSLAPDEDVIARLIRKTLYVGFFAFLIGNFNSLAKIVASSTLDDAPWGDFSAATVTRDPVATIRELKARPGKDLWLWGSLMLMQSLLDAGVVDEVQMRVTPTSRGKGRRIFEDRQDLDLLEATGFDNGIVLLRYAIRH